jgi:hypothetical protein
MSMIHGFKDERLIGLYPRVTDMVPIHKWCAIFHQFAKLSQENCIVLIKASHKVFKFNTILDPEDIWLKKLSGRIPCF